MSATSFLCLLAFAAPQPPPNDPAPIVRRLVEALKDPDPEVRQNLAAALARIGSPAVESLVEALKDSLPERRAGSAYALGLIGSPAARVALPALLDCLDDKDTEVRRQVSYAISRLVPVGRPVTRAAAPLPGGKQ